ncbi:RNA-binding transcriptional accessory protein [Candidatus Fermentibacteria bacterium]|nr:RNA-binding transcriptional accessory protein [Candidatus Fermentibacteria bacterium]
MDSIAAELAVAPHQVEATAALLGDDATVPFIARYRKEATGGLDEVAILAIRDRLEQLTALDARRAAILKSLREQGKLTEELAGMVAAAQTMATLEDVYLPHRPKRRTRAIVAREKGLEPLASLLLAQGDIDPDAQATAFVDEGKGVSSVEAALEGARDILAEWVSEDANTRASLRALFRERATIRSKVVSGKEDTGGNFRDYFAWEEMAATAPSHRILAIRRGSDEGILTTRILPPEEDALGIVERHFLRGESPATAQVRSAVHDSYRRLLGPSLENEIRAEIKERADREAIAVFSQNLRNLLLAPPLGQKAVLAIDPGLRTGCKVVCLDRQGRLLHSETLYPLAPFGKVDEARTRLQELARQFGIEALAVGNGTGGRETYAVCRAIDFGTSIPVVMVNESGASVYSASEVAREEFPDRDVTVRGAISIGRRLMDPLAELVKVDPKAIGVGQYQHDVDQKALRRALDDVVTSCVNAVGVEVNTASAQLLRYVSGLSERLASALVVHRDTHGPFTSRIELEAVGGIGPKTFQQAAGFLRIREGSNPLDASGVHPERYALVETMAHDAGCTVTDLMGHGGWREKVDMTRYVSGDVGMPTLRDIMAELAKPGRDPRRSFEPVPFMDGIKDLADLKPGMRLPGVVTNVTAFGAFVDVGVHQDGLVHISQLADRFVRDPHEVVKVNQQVTATVLNVDTERQRISLSLRHCPDERPRTTTTGERPTRRQPQRRPARKPTPPPKPASPPPNNPFGQLLEQLQKPKRKG